MNDTITRLHPVDKFVGERLKELRKNLKLSQTSLGKLVGVSFQQIQKYENGQNRIPASKLFEFAEVLNAPVTYFYEGMALEDSDLDIPATNERLRFKRTSPLNILLISPDPSDVVRTKKAIEACRTATNIHVEKDGMKALHFMRHLKGKRPFIMPDIMITSFNMPKLDGLSLLKEIKRDKNLKQIPVIILTNSIDVSDMLRSYRAGASGFVGKSVDDEQFAKNIEATIQYWANAVVLPSM